MIRALALLACLAGPVAAAPLTGDEFEAYVAGRTLRFALPGGRSFGVEAYGPDRSVTWSDTPGICRDGVWYDMEGLICFRYPPETEGTCWTVTRTPQGLRAESTGGTILFESPAPQAVLTCDGPDRLS